MRRAVLTLSGQIGFVTHTAEDHVVLSIPCEDWNQIVTIPHKDIDMSKQIWREKPVINKKTVEELIKVIG